MSAISAAVQGAITDLLDEIDSYRGDMNLEPGELERMLTLDSIAFRVTDEALLADLRLVGAEPKREPLVQALDLQRMMRGDRLLAAFWPSVYVPMSPTVATVDVRWI